MEKEFKTKFYEQISKPVGFSGFFQDIVVRLLGKRNRLIQKLLQSQKIDYENPQKSGRSLQIKKVNTYILEIEWLEQNLTTFLHMVMSDELTFDNPLVKELVIDLEPYWYPIFTFIFIPFMTNFCLVTYYFCFVLSDPAELRDGFVGDNHFGTTLRFLILGSTAYLILVDIVSVKEIVKDLIKAKKEEKNSLRRFYVGLGIRLLKNFLLLFNVWIVVEHSTNFTKIESIRLT